MLINWSTLSPILVGLGTILLMWSDWGLTILQERARRSYYAEHYQSYPLNTIEGHPRMQKAVKRARFLNGQHMVISLLLGAVVAGAFAYFTTSVRPVFVGYIWGLFLLVDSMHLGNLFGYRASRRGVHGKILLHQRTAYRIQAGRYASLSLLLLVLVICTTSLFLLGVFIAGLTSTFRQYLWLRKVPSIAADDPPPHVEGPSAEVVSGWE